MYKMNYTDQSQSKEVTMNGLIVEGGSEMLV